MVERVVETYQIIIIIFPKKKPQTVASRTSGDTSNLKASTPDAVMTEPNTLRGFSQTDDKHQGLPASFYLLDVDSFHRVYFYVVKYNYLFK